MWPGVCHGTLHFPAESPAFIDYFLAGFVFKVCYNVSVFDWSKQTVIVRIFGAFLWSGKSLKECSLSGLYCLYLEGKTDKEGLDHCFSHEPVTESINLCGGSGTDFPAATRARALRHPGGSQIGVHGRQRNEVAYCTRTGSAGLSPTRYLSKAQNINS